MNLKYITSEICKIATEGGHFLTEERKNFKRESVVEKHTHDYVSYVDKETEKLLVRKLSALLPEAGFITEEKTVETADKDYTWIIDPLDGTTNYIHDYAPYCVSIALSYKNELIIGVVYEVCRDECFYAWKDGGAYLNDRKINVSNIGNMQQAFIGLDLPYNDKQYKPLLNHLMDKLYGTASSIRLNGSAAISLCYVAAGRYDAWAEAFINAWDFSGGAIIIKEAGGKVTDFFGNDYFSGDHHIIATNGLLHNEIKELISPFTYIVV